MRSKAAWRRQGRQTLQRIAEPATQSVQIREQLAEFLGQRPGNAVACFAGLADEPQLLPMVAACPRLRWAFPRVDGEQLSFHLVEKTETLQPGAYGILEPSPGSAVIPLGELDVFLCPGLGFGRDGSRLGRGKGFYDRALARASAGALRLGIAFREQMADAMPKDEHDIAMHRLVTPDGFIDPAAS